LDSYAENPVFVITVSFPFCPVVFSLFGAGIGGFYDPGLWVRIFRSLFLTFGEISLSRTGLRPIYELPFRSTNQVNIAIGLQKQCHFLLPLKVVPLVLATD
jgi:hypothetical protein